MVKKRSLMLVALVLFAVSLFAAPVVVTWEWMLEDPNVTTFRYQIDGEKPDGWIVVDSSVTSYTVKGLDGSKAYTLYLQQSYDGENFSGSAKAVSEPIFPAEPEVALADAEPVVEEVVAPAVVKEEIQVAEAMPVTETVVQPVAEAVVQPVAEAVVEPVAEAVVEPVAEAVVEPVAEAVVEPVAEAVVEPVAEAVVEPVAVEPVVAEEMVEPVVVEPMVAEAVEAEPVVTEVAPAVVAEAPVVEEAPAVEKAPVVEEKAKVESRFMRTITLGGNVSILSDQISTAPPTFSTYNLNAELGLQLKNLKTFNEKLGLGLDVGLAYTPYLDGSRGWKSAATNIISDFSGVMGDFTHTATLSAAPMLNIQLGKVAIDFGPGGFLTYGPNFKSTKGKEFMYGAFAKLGLAYQINSKFSIGVNAKYNLVLVDFSDINKFAEVGVFMGFSF